MTNLTTEVTTATGSHSEVSFMLAITLIDTVADGVRALTLTSADGAALPAWTPGSHIDITVGGLTRQYSLCSNPDDDSSWRIAVLREPQSRGGSEFVHSALSVGDTVAVTGPRNHFTLQPAERYIFIAGGIGITPLIPMVAEAQRSGAEYTLVYGGRQRASMAFLEELSAHGERLVVWPEDEKGRIDLAGLLGESQADTLIYTCGPAPLLNAVEERSAHWPTGAVHMERFAPKKFEQAASLDEFEVELEASGLTLTVGPGVSILQAARDAGVDVFTSCEEGTCGSCETAIISGEADHRDSVLSPAEQAENTCMMICVSRSKCAKLVLDL
ncbi:PDR/VanB family oxidoreductase [Leifsonia kafniensis]|uniref:PDR/VanB family oxidoreductase n=1 Tax=Leifsonia kafniensis TaxID=475957 RepID=A0ABP7KSX0_9MICO